MFCNLFFLQKVKDSWRVVNHRDIIPTVPRLMGYCHVAHPVYLAAGEVVSEPFDHYFLVFSFDCFCLG